MLLNLPIVTVIFLCKLLMFVPEYTPLMFCLDIILAEKASKLNTYHCNVGIYGTLHVVFIIVRSYDVSIKKGKRICE